MSPVIWAMISPPRPATLKFQVSPEDGKVFIGIAATREIRKK